MHEALQGGIVPAHIFDMVRRIRDHGIAPGLVAMLSHSIVSRIGRDAFLDEAADSGFEGLLIPDLDPVEAEALADAAGARGLATAFLVAQTTTPDRLEHYARLVERTGGFLYLLARAGITGERDEAPDVAEAVARMRAVTTAPLAVGFGISSARHVAAVTASADAAVVGSALVRRMGAADDPVAEAAAFTGALVEGLAPATS